MSRELTLGTWKERVSRIELGPGWTFQKGSMPVGNELLKTPRTLHVSTMMNAMERHIEASMMPKRGLMSTSSPSPKLYSRLMV